MYANMAFEELLVARCELIKLTVYSSKQQQQLRDDFQLLEVHVTNTQIHRYIFCMTHRRSFELY